MQIAFETLLAFLFLFSRRKNVLVCSRSFFLFLNEKVFLFLYKCCIKTRFSRCLSQEFAGLIILPITSEGKSLNFCLCDFYQAKITQVLYVRNSLHLCDRKFARCRRRIVIFLSGRGARLGIITN